MMLRCAFLYVGACLVFGLEDDVDLVQTDLREQAKHAKHAKHDKSFHDVLKKLSVGHGEAGNAMDIAAKFVAELMESSASGKIKPEVESQVGELINSIDTDIIGNVKKDHLETKTKLNKLVDALKTKSQTALTRYQAAYAADKAWYDCITDEAANIPDINSCPPIHADGCPAGCVQDYVLPAAKATLICDLSKERDCSTNATVFEDGIDQWIETTFDTKTSWNRFNLDQKNCELNTTRCTENETAYNGKVAACNQAESDWYSKHSECQDKYAKRLVGICRFGDAYEHKCEAKRLYEEFTPNIHAAKATHTWSDVDRRKEYEVATKVKCLLQGYLDNETIDADSFSTCSDAPDDYDTTVGIIDKRTSDYATYVTPFVADPLSAYFDCTETHITFHGHSWNVPAQAGIGDVPTAAEYSSFEFAPEVFKNLSVPAFTFCAVGETGPRCDATDGGFDASACPAGSAFVNDAICQLAATHGCTAADCCASTDASSTDASLRRHRLARPGLEKPKPAHETPTPARLAREKPVHETQKPVANSKPALDAPISEQNAWKRANKVYASTAEKLLAS